MLRVGETIVFTNATRPPKVVKLIPKEALLDLILASEVDLAGVWAAQFRRNSAAIPGEFRENSRGDSLELILAPENAKSTLLMPN